MEKISIYSEYITLGQFLKLANIISSGGEAKVFLYSNFPIVNGETDNRRGRKLYNGDEVVINHKKYLITNKNDN